jgi:hypothetical protein
MSTRLRIAAAKMRAVVRWFLALGWLGRLVACVVVALGALVWLGILLVVLRVLAVAALCAAAVAGVLLVRAVWVGERADPARLREWRLGRLWSRVSLVLARPETERGWDDAEDLEPPLDEREPGLADVRGSIEALATGLLERHERLYADVERQHRELGGQIEAMRTLVARIAQFENEVSRLVASPDPARLAREELPPREPVAAELFQAGRVPVAPEPAAALAAEDRDFEAALAELEADLRLEKIEEREQMLGELEERLNRREQELAAFVAQTQARLA